MIHIIIGMDRLLRADYAAGKLNRPIGDHLIGVHVGLRPRTCLEHNQWKLFIPSAVDHFLRRTHNEIDFFLRKLAQFSVGQGRTLFQDAEGSNDWPAPAKTLDSNWKVHVRALGLCTPQAARRGLRRYPRASSSMRN